MPTFILLTRRSGDLPEVMPSPADGGNLDNARKRAGIGWWLSDSVSSGGWDHVNIFEAPNTAAALLIANRIESISGARTELWPVGEGVVNGVSLETARSAGTGAYPGKGQVKRLVSWLSAARDTWAAAAAKLWLRPVAAVR